MQHEIFNRVEKKYKLSREEYLIISKAILKYAKRDNYDKYTICNIYFDNDSNELVRTSIDKTKYKEKLRLRSYGIPKKDDDVFWEIKKKYKKVVNKRRITLKLQDVYNYFDEGIFPNNNSLIMKEIDFMIKRYNLKPYLYLAYDREAFVLKDNENFRITFDTNIRSRKYNLSLECGDYGDLLLEEGSAIMEIKCSGGYPLWLVNLLNGNKIYPVSFSKIGNIYKKNKFEED